NGCRSAPTPVSVAVNPPPHATPTVNPPTCGADGSITLTITAGTPPVNVVWNTVPPQTGLTATNLQPGTYQATLTDANGCTNSIPVFLPAPPGVLFAWLQSTQEPTCHGQSNGSATIGVTGGTPPYTFSWSHNPLLNAPTATGLAAGSYSVIVTDNAGCSFPVFFTLGQPAPLTIRIDSLRRNELVSCSGACNGVITVEASGGVPPRTYNWSSPTHPAFSFSGVDAAGTQATGLCEGEYIISVTDARGCTASLTVQLGPTPFSYTLSKTDALCFGAPQGSASVTINEVPNGTTWHWTGPGGYTSPQNATTITNVVPGRYYINFNIPGCPRVIQDSIDIGSPPDITITAAHVMPSCNGFANGTITITAGGGVGGYEYNLNGGAWQGGNVFTGLAAGTYTLGVRDANGCEKYLTYTLPEPTPLSFGLPVVSDVSCHGGSNGSITVSVSGGTLPYEYSLNGGPYQSSSSFTGLSAGSYTVTVRDANGCTAVQTVTVSQPSPLSFTFTVQNPLCFGGNGTIVFQASGGVGNYQYGVNGNYGTASVVSLPAGTYTLTVRDGNGCVTPAQIATITQPPQLVGNVANLVSATCRESSDGSVNLTATGGTPGAGGYTYVWVSHPQYSGSTAGGLRPGSYVVVVRDANGCEDTIRFTVGYRSYVDADVRPMQADGCIPLLVEWVALPSGSGPFRYEWDLGDGTQARDSVVQHVYMVQGNYVVRLIIRNSDGCADTAVATVQAFTTPTLGYTIDPDTSEERVVGTVFTLTSTAMNADRVWWAIPGYGQHEGAVWQVRFEKAGEYCFTMWAQNGSCVDSTRGCIRVRDPFIYVPNAFSPNGDGVNDVFEVKSFGLEEPRVRIYDRWGLLIFDNQGDMTRHWDGTYRGQPVQEDAYTVVIEGKLPPTGRPFKRTTTVTVIR
ncbi:MAG: gliding motility-associated C-terminal domain-containing protein, partial [Bacteroidia bacterium]|nr:gliding motility-associated C-terminal domain-containing protein [Bacteroidia bacterium]